MNPVESRQLGMLTALCLASCSSAPQAGQIFFAVRGAEGPLGSFEVLADVEGQEILGVTCRDGAVADRSSEAWTCGSEGQATLALRALELGITVRSPGLRTQRARVTPVFAKDRADVVLELSALPAPVANADYRTGFGPEATLADFSALAWKSSDELGPVEVVKFYLEGLDAEPQVYFQNTPKHPIHFDFVRRVLGRSLTSSEFVAQTYRGAARRAMAGSVLYRPGPVVRGVASPFTVEFFPSDDLTPDQAATALTLLSERMVAFSPWRGEARVVFYLPAGATQESQASTARRTLAGAGVPWLSRLELYGGVSQQTLNPGVAFGTLRLLTPEQLAVEPVSFRDVVVLTRLPNELPIVGGSITEELQTPLAHVNVAARARGTPNLALVGASKDPRVAPLLGKLVRFEVKAGTFTLAEATLAEADAYWKARTERPKLVPEADLTRTGLTDFASLGFSDSKSVGAKAANLAELSRLLPGIAPQGFAIPFAHYQAFLDGTKTTPGAIASARASCVTAGRTQATCDAVAALLAPPASATDETVGQLLERLLADPGFQTGSSLRFATLAAVRDLFCALPVDPSFAQALDARVASLGNVPVRLRSSTNAEDLPDFSGAGLYTSVGATATGAKAASTRLCRVWGSVWNWTAFEERAFWNIDHLAVRMGVAVHPSYPNEAANGVLVTQNLAEPTVAGMYVNVQKGEVSVTNPEGGALPEIFSMVPGPAGVQVARQRFSSLSPQAPLLSDAEVSALYSAAAKVQQHFAPLYQASPEELTLDLEFKFDGPERKLVIKQARPYFVAH